jgi:hypothetical protein
MDGVAVVALAFLAKGYVVLLSRRDKNRTLGCLELKETFELATEGVLGGSHKPYPFCRCESSSLQNFDWRVY